MYVQYHKEIIVKKNTQKRKDEESSLKELGWMEIRKHSQVKGKTFFQHTRNGSSFFHFQLFSIYSFFICVCVLVCAFFILSFGKHKTNIRQNNIFFFGFLFFYISFLMVFGCLRVQYANFPQSFQWNFLIFSYSYCCCCFR